MPSESDPEIRSFELYDNMEVVLLAQAEEKTLSATVGSDKAGNGPDRGSRRGTTRSQIGRLRSRILNSLAAAATAQVSVVTPGLPTWHRVPRYQTDLDTTEEYIRGPVGRRSL